MLPENEFDACDLLEIGAVVFEIDRGSINSRTSHRSAAATFAPFGAIVAGIILRIVADEFRDVLVGKTLRTDALAILAKLTLDWFKQFDR